MTIPLIIDTDPGVDDAFALALATRSPEVDLLGVTTVFGNVSIDHTTRNAQRLLALLGSTAPVARGADRALGEVHLPDARRVHGDDGLSGKALTLPENTRIDPRDAVEFLRDTIDSTTAPVTIAAIGPLTNIARLLETHAGRIGRLVIMGGGIAGGNVTPAAEFNLWSDADAAHRVFAERPVLVPIDLTRRCAVDGAWLESLTGEVGTTLESLTTRYREFYLEANGIDGILIHDAVAVAEAIKPGILTTCRHLLDVNTSDGDSRGAIVPGAFPVDVAEDTDVEALRAFLHQRLSS
ncbi:nucleoside hydrolase [Umezawaea endophytica]|uniref:Nucleoside hydrolase n=1 Tax=Umezawaea endophytica TaxID=1654476 RepID=A0A9X2VIQ8_9PSEU|nr:nucleoside hydrolase [Umezawaea endophytica]MCS7477385.1 nucleoside hydrolase [Umezawaea endophytica]